MPIVDVDDPVDPRLADYRAIKERHLRADDGRFVAESELVVRKLLASPLRVHSVLATETRLAALAGALAGRDDVPVYRASQDVLDAVTGFHVHRGCLAIGARPAAATLPARARLVVVLEDLVDVDNLGALVRNAAAFGADGLVLSPRCADPYYRKAIRVSMGNVFSLPIVRLRSWPDDLASLAAQHGLALVGAVLGPAAVPLATFRPSGPVALLLGSEGPGLTAGATALCDALVTIPMVGADSLNVATAGAVCLYHLAQVQPGGDPPGR